MKFKKAKVSALTGQTEVRFTEESTTEGETPFVVVSDSEGMRLQGRSPVVENREQLDELAKVIGTAWNAHVDLKRALHSKLMNH